MRVTDMVCVFCTSAMICYSILQQGFLRINTMLMMMIFMLRLPIYSRQSGRTALISYCY